MHLDTFAHSINNRGDIVVIPRPTQPVTHGFVFETGQYRTIDTPHFQYPDYVVPQTYGRALSLVRRISE